MWLFPQFNIKCKNECKTLKSMFVCVYLKNELYIFINILRVNNNKIMCVVQDNDENRKSVKFKCVVGRDEFIQEDLAWWMLIWRNFVFKCGFRINIPS